MTAIKRQYTGFLSWKGTPVCSDFDDLTLSLVKVIQKAAG